MKAPVEYENFRVVVYPQCPWIATTEEKRRRYESDCCREIADQIKRHVDNIGAVSVEFDSVKKCEHCGYAWTEDSDLYNGGCCDKDQAEHEARNEVPQ